jgi:hypothetical protein
MKSMFIINDIDFIIKVYDLGKEHGKKPGESCQEEFEELLKQYPDAITFIGHTDKDSDLLTGDLRENGCKVININEIDKKG